MSPGLSERLLLALAPPLAARVIRLLGRLLRTEILGAEHPRSCWQAGERVIFVFWHDELLLMPNCYRGEGAKILISASKDGELIARTVACFGMGAVRGSSRRGGRAAFRELLELAREPLDLAITPDGPKGPRHQLKEGVVQLARLSGRPVVPLAFACSRGHRFASWDRFLLPYPFGRGVYVHGAPLRFRPDETPQAFQERLQRAMEDAGAAARTRLEEQGVSPV